MYSHAFYFIHPAVYYLAFIRQAVRNSEFTESSGTKLALTFKGKYVGGDGRGRISSTNPRHLRQRLSNNTKVYQNSHNLDRD
jgi:hypothetical protein